MNDDFYLKINKLKGIKIYKDIDVKEETNMKLEAKFLYKIEIASFSNVKEVFKLIKEYKLKYYILGMGSNVLFANNYFNGVLIKILPSKNKYLNIVGAGDCLNYLNDKYLKLGISSLNFLSGVPCSIGGAIYMNAGAFNMSMSDIVEYVYILDLKDYKIKVLSNRECDFSYRDSYFKHHNILILGAKIKLFYQDIDSLNKLHKEYLLVRNKKMPLNYPNLGSIFKNPKDMYVGKMVEDLDLKGLKVGGAKISKKHGNVIINYDHAKYSDILELVKIIMEEVYIKYKIYLELEIIIFK